ncbi:MAG: arylsulfatase [Bacteroidota bacterium]
MTTLVKSIVAGLAITLLVAGCDRQEISSPNVLIILADDLGFSDLGCYGGEIKTPSLDMLASNGLRFTQFYNCGRCWPTRASLLTGYYPQQVGRDNAPGIEGGGFHDRSDWAWLLPKYLDEAGYRSYHSGKWHIDGMPVGNGFDHSYFLNDQERFFSPEEHYVDDSKLPPVSRGSGFYGTVEIAERAIGQLKEHQANHPDKPFFAYVAFTAPHFPLHALPEDISEIGDRYAPGWDRIRQQRWERIREMGIAGGQLSEVERNVGPPYHFPEALERLGDGEINRPVPWESLTPEQKQFQQNKMTIHAAMIERVDKEIGRIVEQLRKMEVYQNTLIVFLSDNGASAEIMIRADGHDPEAAPGSAASHLCLGPGWSNVSNTPFRRHKTWVHEGGICTPFIAHWPEGIAAKGELRHDPGHVIDVVPTILDLAGVSNPDVTVPLPGQSLKLTFNGDTGWERSIWWYHEGNRAMRMGEWKIVAASEQPWELIRIDQDRTESDNLAGEYPEKVLQMETAWQGLLDDFRQVAPE